MTSAGQLALASEFRFDVFRTEQEHLYITVKRGRGRLADRWAIAAGESDCGRFFDGECWSFEIRGENAYFWELEPALVTARELAFSANQEKIRILEQAFPGNFVGGPYDQAVKRGER